MGFGDSISGGLGKVSGGISGGINAGGNIFSGAKGMVSSGIGSIGSYFAARDPFVVPKFNPETIEVDKKAFAPDKGLKRLDKRLADMYTGASDFRKYKMANVDPMQAAQIDLNQANALRANQMGLIERLQAAERGEGPSLANEQLKAATDRNLAQQMAMAASTGGAIGLRQLGQQQASTAQQLAQQSAMNRMQEQIAARQELAGALQSGRAMDAELAQAQAQLGQQAGMTNLETRRLAAQENLRSQLQRRQDIINQRQIATNAMLNTAQQRAQGRQSLQDLLVRQNLGIEGIRAQAYGARTSAQAQQTAAGLGALSDIGAAAATQK